MTAGVPPTDTRRSSLLVPIIAGLLGALAMTASLGPSLVDPTNIDWLMHADYRLHFLGWHLYRTGPWTLPIGAAPLLIWPVGSSIGLTDAIPIVGIPLKLIESILPAHFQFIGLWLVLSFALQGLFGALLMQLATPRPALQLLGAAVFIMSPPLIFRILHAALTAHWLVLAALWLSLRGDSDIPSRRLAIAWVCLCAAAAATQPYIMLMIVVMMLAACARQVIASPRHVVGAAGMAALAAAASGLALWQSGSLMVSSDEGLEVAGFGGWSANLLTFIMPLEAGNRFGPGQIRYASGGQYEGYAYLGAGVILLAAVVLLARVPALFSRETWRTIGRRMPFLLGLLALAAMAVGPTVTFGPRTLFTYDSSWWGPVTIFRTHGRMIWPLYYAVIAGVLFAASRFKYPRALVACAVAVVLQAADVSTMTHYIRDLQAFGFRDPLESRFWNAAAPHYRQLVLIPSNLCTLNEFVDYSAFSLLAGRHGLGINAGITARYDVKKSRVYCNDLAKEVRDGMRTDGSLYIVRADLVPKLAPEGGDDGNTRCTIIDGFGVCFAPESYTLWRDQFDLVRSRLPSREEFVRFYDELNAVYRTALNRPPRTAPGTTAQRVEGIARYLAYRMEGCTRADSEARTLRDVIGASAPELCPGTVLNHELPPADQTYAFAQQLDRSLAGQAKAADSTTHVDLEGEAVWIQAYARERARGVREPDARRTVLAAVAGGQR